MDFIIINGSPRLNGNTHYVLGQIFETLSNSAPDVSIKPVNITDFNISGCIHCDACHTNGHRCIIKDDGNSFADLVENADVLILGTPVYWWGICGQLKTAIDRLYAKGETLKGHRKLIVAAIGADDLDSPQYDLIKGQFQCICDYMDWDFAYYLPLRASKKGDAKENKLLSQHLSNITEIFQK